MTFRAIEYEELRAAAEVQARGFGFSVDDRMAGYQNNPRYDWRAIRVLEEDGRFVASLGTFERNMILHGSELAAGLVGGVGVPPEERRRGYAKQLMQGLLREHHEQQLPISLLFPFAVGFYRSLGYGLVNYNYYFELPPRRLPDFPERMAVRRATRDDADEMRECYEQYRRLAGHNGRLSRTDWEWEQRVWSNDYERVVYQPNDAPIDGYLVYQRKGNGNNRAKVIEWVAANDSAWRGIAGFLRALGDQIVAIEYNAPRNDPFVHLMRDPYAYGDRTIEFCFREVARVASGFMLRVVHAPTALRERSYPAGLSAGFTVRITDDHLPENKTPLRVQIADGAANVAPAAETSHPDGPATAEMDIMTFSELYAGVLRAEDARRVGRLRADDATCAKLTQAFATAPLFMHQTDWF